MHLKSLEIIGFKSFADRTLLEFGEGITAIVGPNGCGKSNISDAIRWVLGEQSARLLRGSKMEDCIFNGTDSRKPLNLAEVSLTFTDCEGALGTDYHEVTVTRRVYRTGEGQYFINRTACRLKDIQRLFMDTGIGTSSYSLMEQGRIDLILRSRPDDRREVFEEASGITKYKTDKREALRKLEQTENNLLRLADIVKEVKRQIISLQRQAGKAARHKAMFDSLRRLDVFASREKLSGFDAELKRLGAGSAALAVSIGTAEAGIRAGEAETDRLREQGEADERRLGDHRQARLELQTQMSRTRETAANQRRRIAELQEHIGRDGGDIEVAERTLEQDRKALEQAAARARESKARWEAADRDLRAQQQAHAGSEAALESLQQGIRALMAESLELDDRQSRLQNEWNELENQDRHIVSRRERCAAEQANLKLVLEGHERRRRDADAVLAELTERAARCQRDVEARIVRRQEQESALRALDNRRTEWKTEAAALDAQIGLLAKRLADRTGQSESVRAVLHDPGALALSPGRVVGALADVLKAEPDYRLALEAVLRGWWEAVVVADSACARDLLSRLESAETGSLCLLAAGPGPEPADAPAEPPHFNGRPAVSLAGRVAANPAVQPLVRRLLRNVWVVEDLADLPSPVPEGVFVTRSGSLARGESAFELYRGDARAANPLARRHMQMEIEERRAALDPAAAELEREWAEARRQAEAGDQALQQGRGLLEECRRVLARHEGEQALAARQADQVRENLETITYELRTLEQQGSSPEQRSALVNAIDSAKARRAEIKRLVESRNGELAAIERTHKRLAGELTAASVTAAHHRQAMEHQLAQQHPLEARIAQAEALLRERSARVGEYRAGIASLEQAVADADRLTPEIEAKIREQDAEIQALQAERERQQAAIKTLEEQLRSQRAALEAQRVRRNEITVQSAEARMKRDHLLERVTGDYRLAPEALDAEPEPEWPDGGRPPPDVIEAQIAELRAKLEAMGPVNAAAIEEYQQLQERFAFLTQQQDDLVKSKQQLMDLIRKINQTTTELFSATFARINENFQTVFQQLFGGGSARLILTDEEDILECGIEIYARPPGKRLQSISLLSGGESTMTAVALLFAIYMVKPSPFCLLDEMDAALDDSNIHRFVKMVQGFLGQSQFLVITHNRQTISVAGTLYGVTMESDKVSRIISMRFKDARGARTESRPAPEPAAAPAADAPAPG